MFASIFNIFTFSLITIISQEEKNDSPSGTAIDLSIHSLT